MLRDGLDGFVYVLFTHPTDGMSAIGRFTTETGQREAFVRHRGSVTTALVLADTSLVFAGSHDEERCPTIYRWSGTIGGATRASGSADLNLMWPQIFTDYRVAAGAPLPAVERLTYDGVKQLTVQVRDPVVDALRTWRLDVDNGQGVVSLPGVALMSARPEPGNGRVDLSWLAVAGATGYRIAGSAGSPPAAGATEQTVTGTTWRHEPLANGQTCYYVITAMTVGGAEAIRSAVLAAIPTGAVPAGPTGVKASIRSGAVILSWDPVANALRYNVYFGTSPGVTTTTGQRLANRRSPFVHSGLSNGTRYYYVVTAVSGAGESAPSAEVSKSPRPSPTKVRVESLDGAIRVSWDYGFAG